MFKLRQDFIAAAKVQMEDDITASVVVPAERLATLPPGTTTPAYKFADNCESRLFQRPDDAIHRGLDRQTEADMARPGQLRLQLRAARRAEQARAMVEDVVEFDEFTPPMQQRSSRPPRRAPGYVVCSANPRLVDGKPSKNPATSRPGPTCWTRCDRYVAERGMRLARGDPGEPAAGLPRGGGARRPAEQPARPRGRHPAAGRLRPIHYQELPELFMDFICSLTGKSPSTTGAGSEGALTKGPFNALRPRPT